MNDAAQLKDEGRFAADLYLQSLVDHGEAMNHEEAGGAFAETVCDEIIMARKGGTQDDQMRLLSFLSRIGEALWWQAEKEREERSALSFDLAELRRLIVHAHQAANKALGDVENQELPIDAVAMVLTYLQAMGRVVCGPAVQPDDGEGKQVARVIQFALAGVAKKGGAA
jgi:hypothetical protein